jgi:hypothetical protein
MLASDPAQATDRAAIHFAEPAAAPLGDVLQDRFGFLRGESRVKEWGPFPLTGRYHIPPPATTPESVRNGRNWRWSPANFVVAGPHPASTGYNGMHWDRTKLKTQGSAGVRQPRNHGTFSTAKKEEGQGDPAPPDPLTLLGSPTLRSAPGPARTSHSFMLTTDHRGLPLQLHLHHLIAQSSRRRAGELDPLDSRRIWHRHRPPGSVQQLRQPIPTLPILGQPDSQSHACPIQLPQHRRFPTLIHHHVALDQATQPARLVAIGPRVLDHSHAIPTLAHRFEPVPVSHRHRQQAVSLEQPEGRIPHLASFQVSQRRELPPGWERPEQLAPRAGEQLRRPYALSPSIVRSLAFARL